MIPGRVAEHGEVADPIGRHGRSELTRRQRPCRSEHAAVIRHRERGLVAFFERPAVDERRVLDPHAHAVVRVGHPCRRAHPGVGGIDRIVDEHLRTRQRRRVRATARASGHRLQPDTNRVESERGARHASHVPLTRAAHDRSPSDRTTRASVDDDPVGARDRQPPRFAAARDSFNDERPLEQLVILFGWWWWRCNYLNSICMVKGYQEG